MKGLVVAAWLAWALGIADVAEAHRVNIFAYVDGDVIRVECGFSRGRKVRQGIIEVFDNVTGERLLQGATDDAGVFVFPVPQGVTGHDLRIGIDAGQGHRNEWVIAAGEMAATPSAVSSSAVADAPAASGAGGESVAPALSAPAAADPATRSGIAPSISPLTRADVQAVVNEALDARLAPIRHMLASQFDAGPSLKDIVGGIGWIFGLVGVAAWFRRRG